MHVLIIGAGLAGLTCGRILDSLGVHVTIVEASDGIGGRVRSDHADGFTLDRGFQVLFEAYPAARRHLDLDALHLRRFDPGAIICLAGKRFVLTDPLRDQAAAFDAALAPIIPPFDKLRVLLLAQRLRRQSIDDVLAGDDETTLAYLRRSGFSEQTINTSFVRSTAGFSSTAVCAPAPSASASISRCSVRGLRRCRRAVWAQLPGNLAIPSWSAG